MFHLKVKLEGKEQFTNGERAYQLQGNLLVHTEADGLTIVENFSMSDDIKYTFISCDAVTDAEIKLLLNDTSEATKFKLFQPSKLSSSDRIKSLQANPNGMTSNGEKLVVAIDLYGLEFAVLADTNVKLDPIIQH